MNDHDEARVEFGLDNDEPMTPSDSPSPRTGDMLVATHIVTGSADQVPAGWTLMGTVEAEAAQEAPAPEGLRDAVADIASRIEGFENRGYVSLDIGVVASWRGTLRAALSATAPSPAEPPRPDTMDGWTLDFDAHERWLVLTDPEGASAVVASGVSLEYGGDIARRWRAEARPPEGLDAAWAAAEAALPEGWGIGIEPSARGYEVGAGRNQWFEWDGKAHPDLTAALSALAARLSARGAESR